MNGRRQVTASLNKEVKVMEKRLRIINFTCVFMK